MEKRKSTVNPSICLEKRIYLVSICCWLNRKPPAMRQNAWKRGMLEPLYLNLMRRSSHKPLAIYRKTGNYDYFPIFSFVSFFFNIFFFFLLSFLQHASWPGLMAQNESDRMELFNDSFSVLSSFTFWYLCFLFLFFYFFRVQHDTKPKVRLTHRKFYFLLRLTREFYRSTYKIKQKDIAEKKKKNQKKMYNVFNLSLH